MSSRFAQAAKARLLGVLEGASLRAQAPDVAASASDMALRLCECGVGLVLYRDPHLDVTDMVPIARDICAAMGPSYPDAKLLIEDRIGVALAVDAAGTIVADPAVDIADVHNTMGPQAWSGVVVSAGKEWPSSSVPDDADLVIVTDKDQEPLGPDVGGLLADARKLAPTAHILAYVNQTDIANAAILAGADGVAGPAPWLSGPDGQSLVADLLNRFGVNAHTGAQDEVGTKDEAGTQGGADGSAARDLLTAK